MFTIISAGLLLGLAASLHCVGMCGPLSLALPVYGFSALRKVALLALYHAGRIFTYAALGLIFGLLGHRLYLGGLQQILSVVLGAVMLLSVAWSFTARRAWRPAFIKQFNQGLQHRMIRLLDKGPGMNYWLFGALNGLLPCGMVYIAVAAATSTGDVGKAVLFMSSFGFATLPALLIVTMVSYLLNANARSVFRRMSPYLIGVIGALLVLRGLDLGIPFISPALPAMQEAAVRCH